MVERLDRSKPPPGYWADEAVWDGTGREPAPDECYSFGRVGDDGRGFFNALALAVAAAWDHFERLNDPPLIRVRGGSSKARTAAWAHYWRRVVLAARLDAEVVVLVEFGDGGTSNRVPTTRPNVAATLRPMLTMADDEDAEAETIAEVERLFSEGRLTFEGDPPIELASIDAWPRCLAWPDEQVAAVERWLAEGGELPEVLRAT